MQTTAGIDLASQEHRLVVVDSDGRRLENRRYLHREGDVSALVRRLWELDIARVAIEQPNGLVVDRLLDAGIAVVAVHPNQLAAARDRYRTGGGKSDGFDGYVLAELARTDMHRLRLLQPDRDETKALRTLTRTREHLVERRVTLVHACRERARRAVRGGRERLPNRLVARRDDADDGVRHCLDHAVAVSSDGVSASRRRV